MLAGAVRDLSQPLRRRAGRRAVRLRRNDDDGAHGRRPGRRRRRRRRGRRCRAPRCRRSVEAAAKAAGARLHRRRRGHAGARLARACARSTCGPQRGATERIDCDLVAISGGWSPTVHLTSHLAAGPCWSDASRPSCPATLPRGMARRRRRERRARPGAMPRPPAREPGCEAAGDCGADAASPSTCPTVDAESTALDAALARARRARQGVRRFPERRHGRRHRARRARGLPLGRAPEALHHARHGDRPGQDLQRQRPGADGGAHRPGPSRRPARRPSGRPITPVAIGALAGHHRGKDFRPTRLPPSHAWAQEQGAVFVETGAWLRAQWYPAAGETDWLRERHAARCAPCARASASAMSRRSARSTCRVPDAAAFLDRVYINTWSNLAVGRARYGLMLREDGFVLDDGTTSRLGRRPLHRHHHDANAGQGDAAHGVLPPGAVAGTRRAVRLGHRPVGAILGRRPAARAMCCARSSIRQHDISNAAFPYMAAAELTVWAACRRACSASRSPASSPTKSPCRRATATR